MADKTELQVRVLDNQGTLFDGSCRILFVPTKKDEIAILPLHTPLIGLVGAGEVKVQTGQGIKVVTKSKSGIIHVGDNIVTVLVNI